MRFIPSGLADVPPGALARIDAGLGSESGAGGWLESVDGVRTSSFWDGSTPLVYVAQGEHVFEIVGDAPVWVPVGTRFGNDLVVRFAGYTSIRVKRTGSLMLNAGERYTIRQLFERLPKTDGELEGDRARRR